MYHINIYTTQYWTGELCAIYLLYKSNSHDSILILMMIDPHNIPKLLRIRMLIYYTRSNLNYRMCAIYYIYSIQY